MPQLVGNFIKIIFIYFIHVIMYIFQEVATSGICGRQIATLIQVFEAEWSYYFSLMILSIYRESIMNFS